ncbi:ATP-binding protein [Chryseobacterium camelliae]|uniref:ATP-binding protein n=1 Tax=Chryseobacterium camelliae TaxID=1265445 RepID=UPI000C1CA3C9|nr:ATP-binding protein [Chryseobacterium camelliae]
MDHTQKLRIKTAMIVYELETSLGNYVIENEVLHTISESSIESIIDREKVRGNVLSKENLNLIIESSYLDEIFNFAINITLNTSLHQHMVELKQLCLMFGIFDIRNAVSHPNRPFPDCYWFRVAAIASDPLIEKLSLSNIRTALNSAMEENLNTPPDEWLYNVNWAIPNTLPSTFDHEITGLLGRDKEFKDLESVLSKRRNNLIAIVAPGGVGKTALVLQYLKDISLNPIWTSRLSCIVFCSLKNEKLTIDGIEPINAIIGLEQIKETIFLDLKKIYSNHEFTTIEEAIEILEDENILICIDNLETLLMDSQKEFIEFNEQLPISWKVLVTSRISIDSATTVPLEPLVKRHAVNLSRNYLKKRGVLDFKQEDLEKIASTANNNPLAIRLTIDLYLKDGDIISSISKSQKDIASFSYKNLIEVLKQKSIVILEAIYAIGNPNRSELIEFLNFSKEDIIESINELGKTSLIFRTIDEYGNDIYELSDSIKDLLLTNPKNIEVRNSITEEVKKRKAKILEQSARIKQLGLSEFDEEYIPDNIDPTIYSLVTDLNKCLGKNYNHSDLIIIKEKFNDILKYKNNDALLLYHFSRIFKDLKDTSNELSNLIKAEEQNPESPRIKLAIALRYFYNNDYLDALNYFEFLISKNYDETLKSNKKFSFSVTKLYYLSLIYLGEYDKILDKSINWQSHLNWSGIIGVSRATALKRKIEFNHSFTDIITPLVEEIFDILNYIFETEGYFDIACTEANKIIKDIDFIVNISFEYSQHIQIKYLSFVAKHFFNIISKLRNENINNIENQIFIKKLFDLELIGNPIKVVSWFKRYDEEKSKYDSEHILELSADGYEIVKVYHIPEDKGYGLSSFMFAENKEGQQFYLSVNFFDEGWNRWGYIKEGDLLAIKYKNVKNDGKPYQAIQIIEIDKY